MSTEPLYQLHGQVALVTLSNPPVNSLSIELRNHVHAAVSAALRDRHVGAVVLIGAGRMFSGGADIKGFGQARPVEAKTITDLFDLFRSSPVPIIAAIHGKALGGGLELALGCHYRVAHTDAEVGLPEVKLGLLPGGGGTQRIPRLAGIRKALEMIVGGEPVTAADARRHGIVDELLTGDLVTSALRFAVEVAARPLPALADDRPVQRNDAALAAARDAARKQQRGYEAPLVCIDCIEQSTGADAQAGLQYEKDAFYRLMAGPQHAALKYQFFAPRTAAKVGDVPADTPLRKVERVGVLGAGTMGSGIAMSFANAGMPVTLVDASAQGLDRGVSSIHRLYAASAEKGRLTRAQADERIARITPTLDVDALAGCDLVIEAVFEKMDLKQEIFGKLDRLCKPGAILATNTSRLDVDVIAAATKRPQDVIGLHFFSPANVMKLLEVVRGRKTAKDVIATSMQLARQIGKVPVLVGVCDGFVGNRMLSPYSREAEFMLEEGATPEQVDGALYRFGLAMGRFQMSDLAGLDVGWHTRKAQEHLRPKDVRYSRVKDRLCELGRFGQKTGAGYYRYDAGSRTPRPDPVVAQIIEECAKADGIARRTIGDEEIVQRTIYALVNEGARVLAEGIAQRASDIDVIYVNGYGFPAWRGGPMFYADTVGLPQVLETIRGFHARHGELWKPAPLLERLVSEGRRFQDL